MDNYLRAYLFDHDLDDELKQRLSHFGFQYLLKVANLIEEEAALWGRDISPWGSLYNGNYHRSYSNLLLRSIEKELARRSGVPLDTFVLINERAFGSFPTDRIQGQRVISSVKNREAALLSVIRGGYTPSLQDAASFGASLNLSMENPTFEFPEKEEFCGSIDEFLKSSIFVAFKKKNGASPLIPLLEGFSSLPIDSFFHTKKEAALLFDSYGRVLHALKEAMKVSLQRFENFTDLVYEEMLFWLLCAEPYSAHQLEKEIQKIIPPPSFFRSVQTGMSAFSEIANTLVKPDSSVMAFDDCYYESLFHLKGAQIIRGPDYEIPPMKKVDFLFVDFHNNILPGKKETHRHDVKSIFSKVLRSSGFSTTLVIDNTIGFLNSLEIRELLAEFPHQNIIIYWSHQKFDLLGCDKVSGGSYAVYSRDERFLDLFRALRGGEIDRLSRQVLTHFFTFGAEGMEERKRKIFSNGWYANQRIDQKVPGVVKKWDPCSFSVDICVEGALEKEKGILKKFQEKGVPLTSRLSFGYNITSQTTIKEEVMRFSLGAEDQGFIDQFIEAFNSIFLVGL
jgi:hypothetical protein